MEIRAFGRSMWPLVPPGAVLEIEPLGGRVPAPGEIVVGVRGGRVIAHRVIRVGPDGPVVTRGDAAGVEDGPWSLAELVGSVTAAVVHGVRVPLDGLVARAVGRVIVERRGVFDAAMAFVRPAARLVRAAATGGTFGAARAGVVRVEVRDSAVAVERELDRLLFLCGRDAGADGSTALHDALAAGAVVGATLGGRHVAAVFPPGAGGVPGPEPVLVVHPFARGSVERPLLEAASARGSPSVRTLGPLPRWQIALYRALGLDVRATPDATVLSLG